ncbi:AAA family ATPase [Pengzhenrongella sp.]|jgi:MinD-like ATPase involved in chromosome partitioning or flagellar assembly|uniref:AAA family ATPase n=1 Tax=Pengzhenrongella sp. TaxID=2888820 RepID=UPI002F91DC12
MSNNPGAVAPFPVIRITIADQTVKVNGRLVDAGEEPDLHRVAVHAVARDVAQELDRPVRAIATADGNTTRLVIHPDGTATDVESITSQDAATDERAAQGAKDESDAQAANIAALEASLDTVPGPERILQRASDADPARRFDVAPPTAESVEQNPESIPTRTRREARASFLLEEQVEEPAIEGLRGLLTRAGLRMNPSNAERLERSDQLAVSQNWPGPRTIVVVNGKGGSGKTPTTILLAAVFALYGGAGVLTWDNNQTRGTLGWRTRQGPHEATLLDLLPQTSRLLGTGAQSADLANYVHHQPKDRFDVLRSKPPMLAVDQRVGPKDVDAIHAVAAKYYRLILIDSGNDESDPMWLRMIDHADQVVVATTTRADHAEAGALLLEDLADRDDRSAKLAHNAVVVVSQADAKATRADVARVAGGYEDLAREVVTIPHDLAMVDGVLRHGALCPATQRAWLAAGAAVARGL